MLRSILLQDENPEAAREKEENGEHLIKSRKRHFSSREIAVRVLLFNQDCEVHCFPLSIAVVQIVEAVVEEHAVEAF